MSQIKRGFVSIGFPALAIIAAIAVGAFLALGCSLGAAVSKAAPGGAGFPYQGPSSLDERIAGSKVIVRARLTLVQAVAVDSYSSQRPGYFGALEYRFKALEYLKGTGGAEFVVIAENEYTSHQTRDAALKDGAALLEARDRRWEDREAILFLPALERDPPTSAFQGDRYWIGALYHNGLDYFSITSPFSKDWLPEALGIQGGASGAEGEEYFLTDVPAAPPDASGAVGQVREQPSMALSVLKSRIAEIEAEIAAGGGSEEYRDCVARKYAWEREVKLRKDSMGGVYHYIRKDAAIASGLPSGTVAFVGLRSAEMAQEFGATDPGNRGRGVIAGQNANLFNVAWPNLVVTARPLPSGEYRFFKSYQNLGWIICNALPEDELKRREVFVTVPPPPRTLHEAFFDPISLPSGVGVESYADAFTVFGSVSTSIASLKWHDGVVSLTLAPYFYLPGHTLYFIALDGSIVLSLPTDSATADADAATLAWPVEQQPWQPGDLLMLRIAIPTP